MTAWRTYVDVNRNAAHVMPLTDPPHDLTECWCHPTEEILNGPICSVLLTHNNEDEEPDG